MITGRMEYVLAGSPLRWAFAYTIYKHFRRGSALLNPLVITMFESTFSAFGYSLKFEMQHPGWSCKDEDQPCTIQRWRQTPRIGYACSTKQIIMLGIYYRFVA